MDSGIILGVGITLIVALVGGTWHVGLRLGRLTEKVNHIDECIDRIESTGGSVLTGLDASVKLINDHANIGLGELRDRIVRLETLESLKKG